MRPPEDWRRARATLLIAAVTVGAWVLADMLGRDYWAAIWGGFIPARLAADVGPGAALAPVWLTPLTATLVHAGILHLAFNMVVLLFCGRPVENVLGAPSLVALYVLGAYAAAAGQYVLNPGDANPMVGASGAISAVLGAYAMLFGRNRVRVANAKLAVWVNALWLMVAWVGLNILMQFAATSLDLGLAVGAHLGGFLVGLLLARPLLLFRWRKA